VHEAGGVESVACCRYSFTRPLSLVGVPLEHCPVFHQLIMSGQTVRLRDDLPLPSPPQPRAQSTDSQIDITGYRSFMERRLRHQSVAD